MGNLNQHMNRKTSCKPIQGDPTKQTPPNTCNFCYKKLKNKKTLTNHFKTCKIKNGGMDKLFKTIHDMQTRLTKYEQEVKELKDAKDVKDTKSQAITNNINNGTINNGTINNHKNTVFNFSLENYGSRASHNLMIEILKNEAPRILQREIETDVSQPQQVADRINELVQTVYRNPEYKQLQNVYVADMAADKDNAFHYDDGKWFIRNWDTLSKELLQKIYNAMADAREGRSKKDVLKVMKHIFVIAGLGNLPIENLTADVAAELYQEIGNRLQFDTIINDPLPSPQIEEILPPTQPLTISSV
jgi:hypothetical protein